jgi:hypothetical protein
MSLMQVNRMSRLASRVAAAGHKSRAAAPYINFNWQSVRQHRFVPRWVGNSFKLADMNCDGTLDESDFHSLVKKLDLDWSACRINALFEAADLDKDGVILPGEWHVLHNAVGSSQASETERADVLKDAATLLAYMKLGTFPDCQLHQEQGMTYKALAPHERLQLRSCMV